MSCWRALELSDELVGQQIPQLLVKPVFNTASYTVYLTDLSNIWSEELDLEGIVDRASSEKSPIEVSKQDTAQLAILLNNVEKALSNSDDAICRVTRNTGDGITLHTSVILPKPLDSLTWKHHLRKRTSTTLRNELVLPLLISSYIQQARIASLISTINGKDKAITRLVDQSESSNLDLAAAFPSVGGLKPGRKLIKREQAARHVPALRPFSEGLWRSETEQLVDPDVTMLRLFDEALVQSTPVVPPKLKLSDGGEAWWMAISTRLIAPKVVAKKVESLTPPKVVATDLSEDETEDEFEYHEHFETRKISTRGGKKSGSIVVPPRVEQQTDDDASTEDDEDLDTIPKSQSKSQSQSPRKLPARVMSPSAELGSVTPPPRVEASTAMRSRPKGFCIGGRSKMEPESPPPLFQSPEAASNPRMLPTRESVPSSSQPNPQANVTPKKARTQFKIGGKGKNVIDEASQYAISKSQRTERSRDVQSPTAEPLSSALIGRAVKEETPVEALVDETPEEKAERKRAELKRKNEEAAKKQAQQRKKKRF